MEHPSDDRGEYSGDASGSAVGENLQESPPLRFQQRFSEHRRNGDRFAAANNNGGSSAVIGDEAMSCFVVAITFSFFVLLTLTFGVYASETMLLGPNSSILIKPNSLFVKSIKVVELDEHKGSMLYGFHKDPPLDDVITWSETHKIFLHSGTHKEWRYYLNEGSQINISYIVNSPSSSSLVLVIAQGNEDLFEWIEDQSYPNGTLSWNIIDGSGSILKDVSKSSSYYIAVGNLNSEVFQVHLNIEIEASLYNTTDAYYKCSPVQGKCTFELSLNGNAAVLTSPGRRPGTVGGDWRVELSYRPRGITYLMGIGGMTALLLRISYFSNHFHHTEQDMGRDQLGDSGSERNPLLSHEDDNLSGQGSSYISGDEEHVLDVRQG